MTRADKAKEYFQSGYNCAQAVALAFSDLTDMSGEQIARLTSGYGGGIGRMREVCGSISGMVFIMNYLYGYTDPKDNQSKKELYSEIQKCAKEFEKENGSIVCRELLGLSEKGASSPTPEERSENYYRKRPCSELVHCSAQILENYIETKRTEG